MLKWNRYFGITTNKDKIRDFEYTDFTQLIRQNGQYYNNIEQKQNIILENGKLVISNMSSELNQLTILIYGQKFHQFFKNTYSETPIVGLGFVNIYVYN